MKAKTKKQETFCPVFSGFYESIWLNSESESDFLYEEGLNYDDIEVDYAQYQNDVAEEFCGHLETYLADFVTSIKYQSIHSPREYNFATDSINIEVKYKPDVIKKFCYDHREELDKYLHDTYTSRSGFISWYDNTFDGWAEYTNGFYDFSGKTHYLGAILEFICQMLEITNETIYYDTETRIDSYIEVINKKVDDLQYWDKQELAEKVIDRIDFSFGYMRVLKDCCIEIANNIGEAWEETICRLYYNDIIKESGCERVKNQDSLEPIF